MKHQLLTRLVCGLILTYAVKLNAAVTNTVQIGNFFFNPTNITINVGDAIRWTNTVSSTVTHDSTRTNTPFTWASPDLDGTPTTFLLTFTNAGTFPYFCNRHVNATLPQNRHPEQTGTVSVVSVNLSPSVSITNPANNTVFAPPANVTIQATASDSDGTVTNVQFLVGTAVAGNDTTLPYAATTNGLPAGSYTLFAIASDNGGLKATNSISIIVNAPPTVGITNPLNNAVFAVPANVTIQATASDTDGTVTNVQFLVGTVILADDTTLPYSAVTNSLPAGTYSLSSIASDNRGAKATNLISIIVNAPPSISLTNPASNARFMSPASIVLQASASDTDGTVTNVQFFSGGNLLGNDTSAPFQFAANNLAAGNYSFTAGATDDRGHSTTSSVVNVFVLTNAILTSPTLLPNGQFTLTVEGITGQTYATERSTDLTAWSAFATNVAPANTFNVTDTTSTNVLIRYYRARQDL